MDTYTLLAKISPQDDVVSDGAECPKCGEPRIDWLVWQDGETLRCETCGAEYMLD